MRLYHATRAKEFALRTTDTSLAPRAQDALAYLRDQPGTLFLIEVELERIADMDEMVEIAEELGLEGYPFELADDKRLQAELRDRGFDAMEYPDELPDNRGEHDTIRVLSSAVELRLLAQMPIA